MGQISLGVPQAGQSFGTEGAKVASDMTTIQTVINGNLDTTNIAPAVLQSATVNTGGLTVKGAVSIAASESRTNVAYGTLTTPDQVTGITLAANGLIVVAYQATWQSSVSAAGNAAIFLGSNQAQSVAIGATSPSGQQATTIGTSTVSLSTLGGGLLATSSNGPYTGDVTTGQMTGPCYIFAAAGTYTISVQFKASSGSVTASNRKLWAQALSFV